MSDRDTLLKNLTELDFMATDIGLYLNTHPTDVEMIEKYNQTIIDAHEARVAFEAQFGPLTLSRSASHTEWFDWIDTPWPWMKEANYRHSCGEK